MHSIGVWVDTHMVLAKVSVIDAAGVRQVRAVIECLRQQMRELVSQGVHGALLIQVWGYCSIQQQ